MTGIFPLSVRHALTPALTVGFLLLPLLAAGQAPVIAHRADISFGVENHSVQITDNLVIPAGLDHLRLGDGFEVQIIRGAEGTTSNPGGSVSPAEDEDGPYQRLDLEQLGLAARGGAFLFGFRPRRARFRHGASRPRKGRRRGADHT